VRSADALRESEAHLESELRHTAALRDLTSRLVTEESEPAIYDEILSNAVAITNADAGSVQVYGTLYSGSGPTTCDPPVSEEAGSFMGCRMRGGK